MENYDFLGIENISLDITDFSDTVKKENFDLDGGCLASPLTLNENEDAFFGWFKEKNNYIAFYKNAFGICGDLLSEFSLDFENFRSVPHLLLKNDDLKIHILPLSGVNSDLKTVGFVCCIEIDSEFVSCTISDENNAVNFSYKGEKLIILASWQDGVLVAEAG